MEEKVKLGKKLRRKKKYSSHQVRAGEPLAFGCRTSPFSANNCSIVRGALDGEA